MSEFLTLTELTVGQALLVGGNRFVRVPGALAAAYRPGDRLVVVESSGALLHVPAAQVVLADLAVDRAHLAFQAMGSVSDEQITRFFDRFAALLEDDSVWVAIQRANLGDVNRARSR